MPSLRRVCLTIGVLLTAAWLVALGWGQLQERSRVRAYVIAMTRSSEHWPGRESADLADLDPKFRARLERVLERLHAAGHPAVVHRTWRDTTRQRFYVDAGWSQTMRSGHTRHTSGGEPAAVAADVAPVGLKTDAQRAAFWRALLAEARREGLTTGATWTRSGVWHRDYPDIGWDPGHVQRVASR